MRLTQAQQAKIRDEHGLWARNACDACGKVLGAVSHTRRDEPGEWCSAICRDGIQTVNERVGRIRRHKDNAERQKAYRDRIRVRAVTKLALQPA